MFNKTLLILLGVLAFGIVHAAPTSTIVQNLFITDLRGNGTKCLKILTNGLVQTSTADCGSGGGGSTTTINGVDGPTFTFASTSPIDIVASGTTFTWTFTNPGFASNSITITGAGLLTGGGDLTANRTISLATTSLSQFVNDSGFVTSSITIGTTTASGIWNVTSSGNKAFTITLPSNVGFFTNDANYITLLSLSGTSPISYNTTTGAIGFTNPGFVTAASSVIWTDAQTWNGGGTFNSTSTFNSSTIINAGLTGTSTMNWGGDINASGTGNFLRVGANKLNTGSAAVEAKNIGTAPAFRAEATSTTAFAFGVFVTAGAQRTFNINGLGSLTWGDGNVAVDTTLQRTATATLQITSNLLIPGWASTTQLWSASTSIDFGDALVVSTSGKKLIAYGGSACGGSDQVSAISATGTVTCSSQGAGGNGTINTSTAVTAGYFPFWGDSDSLTGTSTIFQSSLNIGLGTTQPSTTLHVVGTSTLPTIIGGSAGSSTEISIFANDSSEVHIGRVNIDMLDVFNDNFVYPSGTSASFIGLRHNPTISNINVANPTVGFLQATPVYQYIVPQNWGLAPKAAMSFLPKFQSSGTIAGGADVGTLASIWARPAFDGSVGPRSLGNFHVLLIQPEIAGTSGGVTSLNGISFQPVTVAGTNASTTRGLQIGDGGVIANTIADIVGLDVDALTKGTSENIAVRSAMTASSTRYFLQDNGGAASVLKGNLSVGTTTQTTTSNFWVVGTSTFQGTVQDAQGNKYSTSTGGTPTYIMGGFADSGGAADFYCSGDVNQCTALETNVDDFRMPIACTAKNLHVNVGVAPGAGGTFAITIREAGSPGALTCSITEANTQCSDTSNSEAIAQGAIVTWLMDDTTAVNPTDIGISYTCQ